jgi:PAS domain S-box-containing protein
MPLLLALVVPILCVLLFALLCGFLYEYRRQRSTLGDTQRDLAQSQDHFRLVFEHSGVGMALLDPEGRFLQVNPALVQFFGYKAADLAGRRLVDLAHPEALGEHTNATEVGLTVPASKYERRKRYLRKDGQEVWARVVRVPLRDAAGRLVHIVAVVIDITEQHRAEKALQETEATLRNERDFVSQVLETADALIVVLDPSGRVVRFNSKCSAVSGYQEHETCGRELSKFLIPERFRDAFERSLRQCLNEKIPIGLECPWLSLTGEERLITWRLAVACDTRDSFSHVIAAGLDATEQKKLEEQLRHAQRMETLGTLVGGIAHDFNNQLTVVLGNIRLALESMGPYGPGRCELVDAEQAGQRCADMTQGLLTFSQRRIGRASAIDANEFILEFARLLERVLPATISIETQTAQDIQMVNADRTQLHQLFMNLAVNARDAMEDRGVLTLTTSNRMIKEDECLGKQDWRPGRYVVLSVSDTGAGMRPEIVSRIFEPFFTTKKQGKGTGLGLAMVYGIVKAHGGWITVDTRPGNGSTFRFFLPAAESHVADAADGVQKPLRGGRERILVVDDEEFVRKLVRTILERWGFQVVTAATGEEAVAFYREHASAIDLVLLDYTMPGWNGLQVLRNMQEIDPEVRVVFSSGHTLQSEPNQLLAAGAEAFVAKPYRPEELVARIRQVLDKNARPNAALQEA